MTRSTLPFFGAASLVASMAIPFFASSCASAPPPFGTPYEAYRGFKARSYVGTPEGLRPTVVATLTAMGFQIHPDTADRTFLTATRGMGAQEAGMGDGQRAWTRVGVQIQQVDMHRRAPRTVIELKAESIQGSVDGVIEAGAASVPSTFYEEFFQRVDETVRAGTRPQIRGFLPPA